MLSIAMIGGTYDPDILNEMINKYQLGVDIPACVLQWKMIEGLYQVAEIKLHLINERRMPTYPFANDILVKRKIWECAKADSAIQFPFINLPCIKKISKTIGIYKELRKWYKNNPSDDKVVLIYAMHTPYLLPSVLFARNSNIRRFLIIPDLPKYMNSNSVSIIYKCLKKIDEILQRRFLKYIDGYFLLTKYIADEYKIDKNKYIILEGIADIDKQEEPIQKTRAILYSGALSEQYGIDKLVEAYTQCDGIGELWICGEGSSKAKIIASSKTNDNIKYFGQLSREKVLLKQREASLLINPRDSRDEYTKYSFSSKTMEYMQSGTPLLMAHLKGIPEQYNPYIYWVNNESVDGWAEAMKKLMSLSDTERINFGRKAQKFVSEEKNPLMQAKRMISLMSK